MPDITGTTLSPDRTMVEVSAEAYSLEALQKAAYRIADRCVVVFHDTEEGRVSMELIAVSASESLASLVQQFFRDALDYALRERIAGETAALRNLILASAFSRTRLLER